MPSRKGTADERISQWAVGSGQWAVDARHNSVSPPPVTGPLPERRAKRAAFRAALLTAPCPPRTDCGLLLTAHCSLPTAHCFRLAAVSRADAERRFPRNRADRFVAERRAPARLEKENWRRVQRPGCRRRPGDLV